MNTPWSIFHVLLGGFGLLAALGLTLLAYRKLAPEKLFPMFRLLAVIHILVGGFGLLAALTIVLMVTSALHMNSSEFVIALVKSGPLTVAGLLYAFSGFLLLRSTNKVSGKIVLLQELTVVLLILHCLMVAVEISTHHWFFQVPAGFVILMLVESVYVWLWWGRGRTGPQLLAQEPTAGPDYNGESSPPAR